MKHRGVVIMLNNKNTTKIIALVTNKELIDIKCDRVNLSDFQGESDEDTFAIEMSSNSDSARAIIDHVKLIESALGSDSALRFLQDIFINTRQVKILRKVKVNSASSFSERSSR